MSKGDKCVKVKCEGNESIMFSHSTLMIKCKKGTRWLRIQAENETGKPTLMRPQMVLSFSHANAHMTRQYISHYNAVYNSTSQKSSKQYGITQNYTVQDNIVQYSIVHSPVKSSPAANHLSKGMVSFSFEKKVAQGNKLLILDLFIWVKICKNTYNQLTLQSLFVTFSLSQIESILRIRAVLQEKHTDNKLTKKMSHPTTQGILSKNFHSQNKGKLSAEKVAGFRSWRAISSMTQHANES